MTANDAIRDLVVPDALQPFVAGCDFEPVTQGETSARVFLLRQNGKKRFFLKCGVGHIGLDKEAYRLRWLSGRVRVSPEVAFASVDGREFLITEALAGRDGVEVGRESPETVAMGLAHELSFWHAQPIEACPFNERLGVVIPRAKARTAEGLVNVSGFDEERGGCPAMELLAQLDRDRPQTEDLVLTHGDACVPNVVFDGTVCSGFIDCGRAGVADRYQDLALAARSIRRNLGARWVQPFFDSYGLPEPDERKLAFYRLLDEFF